MIDKYQNKARNYRMYEPLSRCDGSTKRGSLSVYTVLVASWQLLSATGRGFESQGRTYSVHLGDHNFFLVFSYFLCYFLKKF